MFSLVFIRKTFQDWISNLIRRTQEADFIVNSGGCVESCSYLEKQQNPI